MINQLIDNVQYQPINIYLNWGKYDIKRRNMDVEGLRERNSRIFSKLSKLGYNILGGELNAGHGLSSWKLQYDDIFEFFVRQICSPIPCPENVQFFIPVSILDQKLENRT